MKIAATATQDLSALYHLTNTNSKDTNYANQNSKYANQNSKYANQNSNYANQNIKYANQNSGFIANLRISGIQFTGQKKQWRTKNVKYQGQEVL